jgi:hypothetical protein
MGAQTALARTNNSQSPTWATTELKLTAPASDILAELAAPSLAPCIEKGGSPLKQFEKFAVGDPTVTLEDVQRIAGFLLAALQDSSCPQPSAGFERLKRQSSIEKLRGIASVLAPQLACYYLTGNLAPATTRAAINAKILCAELTDGIPDPSHTLLRYFRKKILDSGVLTLFERKVKELAGIVEGAHVPSNHISEKRVQNEPLVAPVKDDLPKLAEKLAILLPFIPDYRTLPFRLRSRLPEAEQQISSFHLGVALDALNMLAQELNEAQQCIMSRPVETSSSK